MVSLFWKSCSEGDLQTVQGLLDDPNAVDIELKDYTGVTPLIEAVKNGHVEIVKLLLDKGADPTNASKVGRPETYTSDPSVLDLLQGAVSKTTVPLPQSPYLHDASDGADSHLYPPPPPPPDAYMYYPMNPNIDGATYYLPPSGPVSPNNGIGHLPPPEIARMIPCRYFPACRYGSQCMFLHPQGPYYQGAMPPYPPYDPMANPYGPYYPPPPPPPFQQPPNVHSVPPMTPPPNPPLHNRSPSEAISPVQPPFSPNGSVPPPSSNYPPIFPPPAQLPMHYSIPQPHPQPPHLDHHSPPNLYDAPSLIIPYPAQPDGPYPPQGPLPNGHYTDPVAGNPEENTSAQNPTQLNGVNGINHHRRGSMRRPSFGSRKPPCLFFPSGRCKNGDECRFPHILPDGASMPTQPNFLQGKGGSSQPSRASQPDGQGSLADKLNNLNLRDDQRPKRSSEGSGRPYPNENGHRPKFQPNGKLHYHPGLNGHSKKNQPMKQLVQRVPNADEFPVLTGSVTPPKLVNENGHNGLTAAQVLQAPPPARKDTSKESSTRDTTPEPGRAGASKEPNGHQEKVAPSNQPVPMPSNKLPVMSFAAAAAASSVPSADTVKEVSVSA